MTTTTISFARINRKRTLRLLMSLLMLFFAATLFTSCKKGLLDYRKGLSAWEDDEYEDAVKAFKKSAKKGNTDAMLMLGLCYENGRGVDKDIEESLEWYGKAAESEDTLAEAVYGAALIGKDQEKGLKYLKKAANKGSVIAQTVLGVFRMKEGDEDEAVKYLKKAAGQPLTGRKTVLDRFLEKEDRNPFTELLEDEDGSAEDGCIVTAQTMLVKIYMLKKDLKEARKWLEKAKKNGLSGKMQKTIRKALDAVDDYD